MGYLNERIYQQLGVKPDDCYVKLKGNGGQLVSVPIFTSDRNDNIKILLYDIEREIIELENSGKEYEDAEGITHQKTAYQIRYNPQYLAEHPDSPKYKIQPGEKTRPFFPSRILDKYDKGEFIKTLYLTEGYIKAFYGALKGFDIVGLTSVTCYTEKDTKKLHNDIIKLIKKCGVKNVVMIYDGDCLDISKKDLERGEELTRRPNMFFSSAIAMKNLLSGIDGVEFWFSHIIRPTEDSPKGLDDLLEANRGREEDIVSDLRELGSVGTTGMGRYFYRLNLTTNANRLRTYFGFGSDQLFFDKWRHIIGHKSFLYFGNRYHQKEDGSLELEIPLELTKYFRIGTGYFRLVPYKDVHTGEEREKLVQWSKTCIIDDFKDRVKNPTEKIRKLNGFTYLPDNEKYMRITEDKRWNYYDAIKYDPKPGYFPTIDRFISHIFEEQKEMGLDYIQLLYQRPRQMLPILCLVSTERQTGKTTFCNFLNDLFGENAIIVGNNAFTGNFNGFMAGKLLVMCDETSLSDKMEVTEKIKRMSTEKNMLVEYKGQDAQPIPNFAKFILCSNNEKNFIYTDRNEVRFWVRKVQQLATVETHLIEKMHEEIPAFLYFLNTRKLSTQESSRAWFDFELLKTKALLDLQNEQRPTAIKEITEYLRDLFFCAKVPKLQIALSDIWEQVDYLRTGKTAQSNVRRMIKDHLNTEPTRGRYKLFAKSANTFTGETVVLQYDKNGTFYTFNVSDFLTPAEIEMFNK